MNGGAALIVDLNPLEINSEATRCLKLGVHRSSNFPSVKQAKPADARNPLTSTLRVACLELERSGANRTDPILIQLVIQAFSVELCPGRRADKIQMLDNGL